MEMLLRHHVSRWLAAVMFVVCGLGLSSDLKAQTNDCDSLWVGATAQEGCCFEFVLEKATSTTITSVSISVGTQSRIATNTSAPQGINVTSNNSTATFAFPNGLRSRQGDLSVCFGQLNVPPGSQSFPVIVRWMNGRTQVCTDTLELRCGTSDECLAVRESAIRCEPQPGSTLPAFTWSFDLINQSSFFGWSVKYTVVSPRGATITPGQFRLDNEPVAPNGRFPRQNLRITGARPGDVVVVEMELCGSSERLTDDLRCCTVRIEIRMPECAPANDCLSIREDSVICEIGPDGQRSYRYCFTFTNNADFPIDTIRLHHNQGVVSEVGLSQPLAPGATSRTCIDLPATSSGTFIGAIVACGMLTDTIIAYDTIRTANGIEVRRVERVVTERKCCDQRIELKLPPCGEPEHCLEILEQEIECNPERPGTWFWCFNVRNTSNSQMNLLRLLSNQQGVTITPSSFPVGVLQPGGVSGRICVQISGASPGPLAILALLCSEREEECCTTRIELRLPDCNPHEEDCCSNFDIRLSNTQPVGLSNGFTAVLGGVAAGPAPIKSVSATLVSATVNGQPVYGHYVSGILLNPFGVGVVGPGAFGQEVNWGPVPGGVNMAGGSAIFNWLRFPPMSPNAQSDRLEFCVRYRFTDINCRTCDTLVCYTIRRSQGFFNQDRDDRIEEKKGPSLSSSSPGGQLQGKLTGQNSGTMQIRFPDLPAEYGEVSYLGMIIQPMDPFQIVSVTADNPSWTFSTQLGLAFADFTQGEGDVANLDLQYAGLDGASSASHAVMIQYSSSLYPGDTLIMPAQVTLRRPDAVGGDLLTSIEVSAAEEKNVVTYALHLENLNGTDENISRLRLQADHGVSILAIGPTASESEAEIAFATAESGNSFVTSISSNTTAVAPGEQIRPIYLTVALDLESIPRVTFRTLNMFGETITTGDLNLDQISAVESNPTAVAGLPILRQSYPNPTMGSATISFRLDRDMENVSLMLTDVNGRPIANLLQARTLEAGEHLVPIQMDNLDSGTYLYVLKTSHGEVSRKLVITR